MSLNIQLSGFDKLEKRWLKLGEDIGFKKASRIFNPSLKGALKPLVSKLRGKTPKRSGRLGKSIGVNTKKPSRSDKRENIVASGRVGFVRLKRGMYPQALATEYGTKNRRGNHLLSKTLKSNSRSVIARFSKAVKKIIEKA